MLLQDNFADYKDEILGLYRKYLGESPQGNTFFGVIDGNTLQAAGSLRCYHGHWYLRGCVVKPEFRGRGLQRQLIRERLEYLAGRDAETAKVSIYPWNKHSIDNVLKEGFSFEKTRTLNNGKVLNAYMTLLEKR